MTSVIFAGHGPVQINDNTVVAISERLSNQSMQTCIDEWGASQDLHTKTAAFAFRFNVLCTMDNILESMFAKSCVESLKVQIFSGCDLNAANKDQDTALHIAAEHGLMSAVIKMVELNADSGKKNCSGLTAFDLAIRHGYKEVATKLQLLDKEEMDE